MTHCTTFSSSLFFGFLGGFFADLSCEAVSGNKAALGGCALENFWGFSHNEGVENNGKIGGKNCTSSFATSQLTGFTTLPKGMLKIKMETFILSYFVFYALRRAKSDT